MTSSTADVIVIGGGPAGVASAVRLRRAGVQRVVLLDREPTLGGATRHCSHSPFGMVEFGRLYFGAAYGRRLEREAISSGVDIRTGYSVIDLGEDGLVTATSHRDVEKLAARRVIVSTGGRETPRSARLLPGDRPIGIVTTGTLQSYVAFHHLMPFRRPLVVGSELVSLSAILTCLAHGARPVAVVEPGPHALVRAPLALFPALVGIPLLRNAEILDIRGRARVESVTIRIGDKVETYSCDGVLLTGQFTPEASLFANSEMGVSLGSAGPAIDQDGRCLNPLYFAGGNVLRAVETGGWSFREGWAVGAAVARDLSGPSAIAPIVPVAFADPIKLVVPNMLRRTAGDGAAFGRFQLRFRRRAKGVLSLCLDGREVWSRKGRWLPERRILVPIPSAASHAGQVKIEFNEET